MSEYTLDITDDLDNLGENLTLQQTELHCPHDYKLYIVNSLGLFCYYHEDHTSCDLMNRFDTSADTILSQYVRDGILVDSIRTRAAIAASVSVRNALYKSLSEKKGKILSESIIQIILVYSNISKYEELIREIVNVFGEPFIKNVKLCLAQDLSKYLRRDNTKYVFMEKLSPKDVVATTVVKNAIEEKQTLWDICDESVLEVLQG